MLAALTAKLTQDMRASRNERLNTEYSNTEYSNTEYSNTEYSIAPTTASGNVAKAFELKTFNSLEMFLIL